MIIRVIAAALMAITLSAQTSSIAGTIRNAHNQIPIPGALVRLIDTEGPLEAFTDAAGHYRFTNIAQGTYNLRIEKEGYLFQPDYALSNQGSIVLEDQSLSLDYVMDQWTSLAGCVHDADGKPIANAAIQLTPRGTPLGAPSITTDAQGCYEVERVFPGSYYVEARQSGTNPPLPPIFHPGTADPSEAQRVPVTPGTVRRGIDIRVSRPTLGVISGRVVDEDGKPLADVGILLNPGEPHGSTSPFNVSYRPDRFQPLSLLRVAPNALPLGEIRIVRSGPDGRFRLEGLVPGSWRLMVQSTPSKSQISGNERVELAPSATLETTVELRARPLFDVQLYLDWSGPPPTLSQDLGLTLVGVTDAARDIISRMALGNQPKGKAAPASMLLRFVSPGPYSISPLVQSDSLPKGYYFAQMSQGGADLQGQPAQLAPNAPPITLVFKPNAAQINGTLEGDTPAIVLLWTSDLARDQAVRTAIAKPGDSFHFGSLAPGTYHLAAFDRIPPDGLTIPFLNSLALSAITVTAKEGSAAGPKLKTARWPD